LTWFDGGFSEPRTPSFTPGREPHAAHYHVFFPELVGGFHTKHSVQRAVMPCGTLRTQQRGWASGCYSRPAVSAVQFSSPARSQSQTMVPWTTPKLPHHVTHVARPRHLWESQTQQSSAWLGAKLCTILQDRDAMHLLQVPERLSQVVPLLPKAMNLGHNTIRVNRMM